MAVIVKGEITITKGFDHWKSMVFSQKEKMAEMGMQFLFAGTEKNDPTKCVPSLSRYLDKHYIDRIYHC